MNIVDLINNIKEIQKEYPKECVDFELSFTIQPDIEKEDTFKRTTFYNICVEVKTQDTHELRYSLINKLKNTLEENEDVYYNLTIFENSDNEYPIYDYYEECYPYEDDYFGDYDDSYPMYVYYDDDYYYEEDDYFVVGYYTNQDYDDYCDIEYLTEDYYEVLKQEKGIFNELSNAEVDITISLDARGKVKLKSSKEDLFEKVKSFNDFARELGIKRDYSVSEIIVTLEDFENQLKDIKIIIEDIIEYNKLSDKVYKLDTWLIYDNKKENEDNSGLYVTLESNSIHPYYINNKGINCNNFPISVSLLTRDYWHKGISPYTSTVLKSENSYYINKSISNNKNTTLNLRKCFNDVCEKKLSDVFTNSFMEVNLSKLKNIAFLDIKNKAVFSTKTGKLILTSENENIARVKLPYMNLNLPSKEYKIKENFIDILEYLWKYA